MKLIQAELRWGNSYFPNAAMGLLGRAKHTDYLSLILADHICVDDFFIEIIYLYSI